MSYGPENLTEALQAILYLEARIIEEILENQEDEGDLN